MRAEEGTADGRRDPAAGSWREAEEQSTTKGSNFSGKKLLGHRPQSEAEEAALGV